MTLPETNPPRAGPTAARLAFSASIAATALVLAGDWPPVLPDDVSLSGLHSWARSQGVAQVLVTGLRAAGLLLSCWVLVCSLATLIGLAFGLRRLLRCAVVISPPVMRRLLAGAVGLTAQLTMTGVPVAGAAPGDPMADPSLRQAGAVELHLVTTEHEPLPTEGPTLHLGNSHSASTGVETAPPAEAVIASTGPSGIPAPIEPIEPTDGVAFSTWTLQAGEHLWYVASEVMADHLGHQPTADETAAYHQRLVESNRSMLAVADQPDLVYPGQVLDLPEP